MHNSESCLALEQSILASILSNNNNILTISDYIAEDDFTHPVHRKMYGYILKRFNNSKLTDKILITDLLNRENIPLNYLEELMNNFSTINIKNYAELLKKLSLRRQFKSTAELMLKYIEEDNNDIDIEEHILSIEEKLLKMGSSHKDRSRTLDINESLKKTMQYCSTSNSRISTGFKQLDKAISIRPGMFIIIAARPSVGKSAFAINLAINVAKQGNGVLIISLEMSTETIGARILSAETSIPLQYFIRNNLDQSMFTSCASAMENISTIPLFINDDPLCTIGNLRNTIRMQSIRHPTSLVIIDYIQLLIGNRSPSKEQELAEISRVMKLLSKQLSIPIICLSQMSRAIEKGANRRPVLADLRGTGALEQDADIVMAIYRPNPEILNETIITALKNRNGPLVDCYFNFISELTLFKETTMEDMTPITEE